MRNTTEQLFSFQEVGGCMLHGLHHTTWAAPTGTAYPMGCTKASYGPPCTRHPGDSLHTGTLAGLLSPRPQTQTWGIAGLRPTTTILRAHDCPPTNSSTYHMSQAHSQLPALPYPLGQGQDGAAKGERGSLEISAVLLPKQCGEVAGQEPRGHNLNPQRMHVSHRPAGGQPYWKKRNNFKLLMWILPGIRPDTEPRK